MDREFLALPAIVLGPAVALWLLVLVPFPGDGGPMTFVVSAAQVLLFVLGAGVFALGVRGYRSGNVRPAVAAAVTVVALSVVGAAGAYYETNVGFLVPTWVWLVAGVAAVALSLIATYRLVPERPVAS
jgi:hypothetical protein